MTATSEVSPSGMVVRDQRSAVNEPAALPLAAMTDSAALMHVITRAAQDPKLDLDRVQRLFEMHEKLQAKQDFIDAMARFRATVPKILKTKRVGFDHRDGEGSTSYTHATLGGVCLAIVPALAAVGISHRWDLEQGDGRVKVTCVLTHVGGHSTKTPLSGAPDNSGKKNPIQQTASTISYLERYTLLAATGLGTEEQDDDGRGAGKAPELMSEEHIANLEALLTEIGGPKTRGNFLTFWKVDSLGDLLDSDYKQAIQMLEDRRRNRG